MNETILKPVIKYKKDRELFLKELKKVSANEEELKSNLYSVAGMLLKNPKNQKEILRNIKEGRIGWQSETFDKIREKLEEHDDFIMHPFEVVDGVVKCPKCGNSKTWSFQKQCRSSDEPMTTFSQCAICRFQWNYSG